MGSIPPSDEWKKVDRGKRRGRFPPSFVNRQTLMFALNVLTSVVRVARLIKELFGDV